MRAVVSLLGIAAVTLSGYQLHLTAPTVVLLFLGVIVWQSLEGGFVFAVLVTLFAAACLDFFFLPPPLTLYIAGAVNVVAFLVFVAMALLVTKVITQLATRLRAESERVKRRDNNLEQLYQAARHLLLVRPDGSGSVNLLQTFRDRFAAEAVCLFDAENAQIQMEGEPCSRLADLTREAYICGEDAGYADLGVAVRCLRVGRTITGAIGFQGVPDAEWTAGPLSVLAAAAMEQARIFRKASNETAAVQAEVFRTAILDALAHEFKTPLATILAVVGGMRESPRLGEEELAMAGMIESETSRLSALTARLLRLAKLDREEVKPRMRRIAVNALAEGVARRFGGAEHEVAVIRRDCSEDTSADRDLLDLAVTQLLDNAIKYSLPGSAVAIETGTEEGFITIRVKNEGSSIAPHERDRIFERFYRGTDARKMISGTGLGLYVARKIAIAHGGSLILDKSTSGGTVVFCLKLPRVNHGSYSLAISN